MSEVCPVPEQEIASDSPASRLHRALDMVRRLHCDRRDEAGHDCQGTLICGPTKVKLRCPLCGPLDLVEEDAGLNAMACALDSGGSHA